MVICVTSFLNIIWIRKSIEYEHGLPRFNQALSYLLMIITFIYPAISEPILKKRLVYILFALINFYLHLSISYESLFVVCLCFQLICLLLVESFKYSKKFDIDLALVLKRTTKILKEDEDDDLHNLTWSNLFRVYLLVFHLLIAFFGTGNMASINSFDPVSVYCFVTVFNPFLMGFLILLKVK
jgi:phosphatidylinositol glycan class N